MAMKNIVLTGFMGTGKSEVGRELARKLGYSFIDLDDEIEKRSGLKISEIFRIYGEEAFRDMETDAITSFANSERLVISTGGGAVLRSQNMDCLRKKGVIVCLSAAPETIMERIGGNSDRPLLNVEDPLSKIRELLSIRQPYYEQADIAVDTDGKSPFQIAEEIIMEIRRL